MKNISLIYELLCQSYAEEGHKLYRAEST